MPLSPTSVFPRHLRPRFLIFLWLGSAAVDAAFCLPRSDLPAPVAIGPCYGFRCQASTACPAHAARLFSAPSSLNAVGLVVAAVGSLRVRPGSLVLRRFGPRPLFLCWLGLRQRPRLSARHGAPAPVILLRSALRSCTSGARLPCCSTSPPPRLLTMAGVGRSGHGWSLRQCLARLALGCPAGWSGCFRRSAGALAAHALRRAYVFPPPVAVRFRFLFLLPVAADWLLPCRPSPSALLCRSASPRDCPPRAAPLWPRCPAALPPVVGGVWAFPLASRTSPGVRPAPCRPRVSATLRCPPLTLANLPSRHYLLAAPAPSSLLSCLVGCRVRFVGVSRCADTLLTDFNHPCRCALAHSSALCRGPFAGLLRCRAASAATLFPPSLPLICPLRRDVLVLSATLPARALRAPCFTASCRRSCRSRGPRCPGQPLVLPVRAPGFARGATSSASHSLRAGLTRSAFSSGLSLPGQGRPASSSGVFALLPTYHSSLPVCRLLGRSARHGVRPAVVPLVCSPSEAILVSGFVSVSRCWPSLGVVAFTDPFGSLWLLQRSTPVAAVIRVSRTCFSAPFRAAVSAFHPLPGLLYDLLRRFALPEARLVIPLGHVRISPARAVPASPFPISAWPPRSVARDFPQGGYPSTWPPDVPASHAGAHPPAALHFTPPALPLAPVRERAALASVARCCPRTFARRAACRRPSGPCVACPDAGEVFCAPPLSARCPRLPSLLGSAAQSSRLPRLARAPPVRRSPLSILSRMAPVPSACRHSSPPSPRSPAGAGLLGATGLLLVPIHLTSLLHLTAHAFAV